MGLPADVPTGVAGDEIVDEPCSKYGFSIAQRILIGDTLSMKKVAMILCIIATPALAADNFAECILDRMPGAQNDAVAGAIYRACLSEHPGGLDSVKQGSGRGFFGYDSGNECIIKKGEKIASRIGGNLLTGSCNKLYDPDGPWLDFKKSNF